MSSKDKVSYLKLTFIIEEIYQQKMNEIAPSSMFWAKDFSRKVHKILAFKFLACSEVYWRQQLLPKLDIEF